MTFKPTIEIRNEWQLDLADPFAEKTVTISCEGIRLITAQDIDRAWCASEIVQLLVSMRNAGIINLEVDGPGRIVWSEELARTKIDPENE